jgi:hypothetical protein
MCARGKFSDSGHPTLDFTSKVFSKEESFFVDQVFQAFDARRS